MSWQSVEIDEVHAIHQALFAKAKIKAGVRDFGLLHSAVERPMATFDGQSLYPSIFDKSAAFLQSLTLNHPFTDGNKRTAWLSAKRLLRINDYHLKAQPNDAIEFMLMVDNEKLPFNKISAWLKKHS